VGPPGHDSSGAGKLIANYKGDRGPVCDATLPYPGGTDERL
jgi:hypothetical protein